ncbi:hypothetical protein [Streptomyces sp. NBC_01006]|uniref:hypothetical protein n=1 Tax=Streptomyces sp. NBC_01006 TaxID=2903716 RepID=UPI0038702841|nr:hypothetical protein OG509_32890 [Streptomyces sp. NBC_01006]
MPGRLTEILYALYLLASGLPLVAASAHRERMAARAAAGFHTDGNLAIPARWIGPAGTAVSGSGS